jgi:hypothetical protein
VTEWWSQNTGRRWRRAINDEPPIKARGIGFESHRASPCRLRRRLLRFHRSNQSRRQNRSSLSQPLSPLIPKPTHQFDRVFFAESLAAAESRMTAEVDLLVRFCREECCHASSASIWSAGRSTIVRRLSSLVISLQRQARFGLTWRPGKSRAGTQFVDALGNTSKAEPEQESR